jgi:hypothetical protein
MVIVFMVTALIGAFATLIALWPLGPVIALASAPFGGSLLTLVAALLVALRQPHPAKSLSERAPGRTRFGSPLHHKIDLSQFQSQGNQQGLGLAGNTNGEPAQDKRKQRPKVPQR